ncbi:hypothetical protein H6P81_010292 [Aristolochia fimbriata]|uniref:Uncharacterized protein n=1 Tax=Aristolochia fimbriata TaxID=158543 RepID=A0AAV7ERS2_ARIFI|nr:hypothetical protein H6P81_010292 [Aristolochia fimbriata]
MLYPSSIFIIFLLCGIPSSSSSHNISLNATVCDDGGSTSDPSPTPGVLLNDTIKCLAQKSAVQAHGVCDNDKSRIHGFAQCRGDLTGEDCVSCVLEAGNRVATECGGGRGGAVLGRAYGDDCVVFVQRNRFSASTNQSPVKGPECGGTDEDGSGRSSAAIGDVFRELIGEDIVKRNGSFARGNLSSEVYGVAQCWGTWGVECGNCLAGAGDALDGICSGSAEGGVVFDGCLLRYQTTSEDPPTPVTNMSPPPNPEASSQRDTSKSGRSQSFYFFIAGMILVSICIILILVFWKFIKPAKLRKAMSSLPKPLQAPDFFSGNLRTISYFDYETLKKATKNFHPSKQLGRGGFGPVYEGKLGDGREIAVKRLALEKSQQGEAEFLAEVRMITSIQHKNLLRLLGCCSDGEQRLLVYEYMKNKSLDAIIYGRRSENAMFLDWKTRFQIILGVARGLQYLHEDSHLRIVHRDIKASNILLDEKFQPKIGDFGLARFFPEDQAYLSTNFAGTLGYTAPEYAIRGELSEKADIYSFGVLVLEIVSCRKNTDLTLSPEMQYLPEYAWKLYERSLVMALVDPQLVENGVVEIRDVLQTIHVALLCLQPYPSIRPRMSEIVAMLTCKVDDMPTPVRPAFLDRKRRYEESSSLNSWETISAGYSSPLKSESPSLDHHFQSPQTPVSTPLALGYR